MEPFRARNCTELEPYRARNCTELWILRQFFRASRGWNREIGVLLVRFFVIFISAVPRRLQGVVLCLSGPFHVGGFHPCLSGLGSCLG